MKKSFFKKLSFVLALAMIVSMIAPASGAFAATKPSLKTKSKVLTLGQANTYDFNLKNKVSGCTYTWTSSNKAVATVDKVGLVTGKKTGKTTIAVKIVKKSTKKTLVTCKATVTVKDNIKDLTLTQTPAADKLAIDTPYTFGDTYTTFGGSTTDFTGVVGWTVDKAEGASITDAGVFTATAAGDYTITAYAFQSQAKYDSWKVSKDSTLYTTFKEAKVTVVPSVKSVKQYDLDTFVVTFDSDMSKSDVATAAKLYQVIGGKQMATGTEKFKKVAFDATGKTATIDMYTNFVQGNQYDFVYGDSKQSFTAAKVDVLNIAGITFADFTVDCTNGTGSKDMTSAASAYNSDGVIIYTGSDIPGLSFTKGSDFDVTKGSLAGNTIYIYAVGTTEKVTATIDTVAYDSTNKNYKPVKFTDDAIATGIKVDSTVTSSSLQFAAPVLSDTTAYDKVTYSATGVTAAVGDNNKIYAKYTLNSDTTKVLYTTGTAVFTYKTTDSSKLVISGNVMYPIAAGTATVVVYNAAGTTAVGAFDVTIVAARSFATATADVSALNIGNNAVDTTGAKATITLADSLGAPIKATSYDYTLVSGPTGGTKTNPNVTVDITTTNGKATVQFVGHNGSAAPVGVYYYKFTITALGTTKDVYFTVNVIDTYTTDAAKNVSYYGVELEKNAQDVKGVTTAAIGINVFGYNAAGAKVAQLTSTQYNVEVKDANGKTVSTANTIQVVYVSGGAAGVVTPFATGNYVVTATANGVKDVNGNYTSSYVTDRVGGAYLGAATLSVTDSTTTSVTDVTPVVKLTTGLKVYDAVKAAYDFVLNGATLTTAEEGKITKVNFTNGNALTDVDTTVANGDNIYVTTVIYTVDNADGSHTNYTFTVNKSFAVKQQ